MKNSKIPVEILTKIFVILQESVTIRSDEDAASYRGNPHCWLVVLRVCKYWRLVAVEFASCLWERLILTPNMAPDQFLVNSQPRKLVVHFANTTASQANLSTTLQQMHRVKELSYKGSILTFPAIHDNTATSSLERLTLHFVPHSANASFPRILSEGDFPNLVEATYLGRRMQWTNTALSCSLRRLRVQTREASNVSLKEVVAALVNMSSLEDMTLHRFLPQKPVAPSAAEAALPVVPLLRLRRLDLFDTIVNCAMLLEHIRLPPDLVYLNIDAFSSDSEDNALPHVTLFSAALRDRLPAQTNPVATSSISFMRIRDPDIMQAHVFQAHSLEFKAWRGDFPFIVPSFRSPSFAWGPPVPCDFRVRLMTAHHIDASTVIHGCAFDTAQKLSLKIKPGFLPFPQFWEEKVTKSFARIVISSLTVLKISNTTALAHLPQMLAGGPIDDLADGPIGDLAGLVGERSRYALPYPKLTHVLIKASLPHDKRVTDRSLLARFFNGMMKALHMRKVAGAGDLTLVLKDCGGLNATQHKKLSDVCAHSVICISCNVLATLRI